MYKINYKTLFETSLDLIIKILISLVFLVIYEFDRILLTLLSIIFALDFFPTLNLFLEYYQNDHLKIVEFNQDGIKLKKKKVESVILFKDIESIQLNVSLSEFTDRYIRLFSFEYYYYATIKLRTGEMVILTSLLGATIKKKILALPVKVEQKRRLYCTIKDSFL